MISNEIYSLCPKILITFNILIVYGNVQLFSNRWSIKLGFQIFKMKQILYTIEISINHWVWVCSEYDKESKCFINYYCISRIEWIRKNSTALYTNIVLISFIAQGCCWFRDFVVCVFSVNICLYRMFQFTGIFICSFSVLI